MTIGHLTVAEAANSLGTSESAVSELIETGRLKAIINEGKPTLIPEPALDAYLAILKGERPPVELPEAEPERILCGSRTSPVNKALTSLPVNDIRTQLQETGEVFFDRRVALADIMMLLHDMDVQPELCLIEVDGNLICLSVP